MPKSQMRGVGVGLFLIGIVVLVGYAMYVGFLSGEKLGAYTIQEFDGSIFSLGGFRMTSGQSVSTHSVGPIALSPQMNPFRLILNMKQQGGGSSIGTRGIDYSFELMDPQGNSVWKKTGTYSDSSDDSGSKSTSLSLGAFEVEQEQEYLLLCDLKDKRTFKPVITSAQVVLRRNVARANSQIYIVSGMCAAAGFVLMMLTAEKNQTK